MNVLLITTDQQRADTLGCEGNPLNATPRLDALAAAGTRYSAARTQNPLCQPARATILTGTYPSTHGVTCNGVDLPADAEARSIATLLADAGFATAIIGKAHFATAFPFLPTGKAESVEGSARVDPEWSGPYFGFGHAELVLFGHNLRIADLMGRWNWIYGPPPFGLHYARFLFRDGFERGAERIRLMQPEAAGAAWDHTQTWRNALPEEDHPTTWIADRAVDWLRDVDGPFFGWISFADPHHPMDPPAPWCDRYSPADAIEILPEIHADEFDGKPPLHRILSEGLRGGALEWANPGGATLTREELAHDRGLLRHGRSARSRHRTGTRRARRARPRRRHPRHRDVRSRRVPRGAPTDLQGPVRLRLVAARPVAPRGPGVAAGVVVDAPVGTIDLAPTVMEAAGLEVPTWMEGTPLGQTEREYVLTENDFEIVASIPMRTITTARYKLHRYLDAPFGELYDLGDDPGELVNRYDDPAYAATRSDLGALLDDVMNHEVRKEATVGLVA